MMRFVGTVLCAACLALVSLASPQGQEEDARVTAQLTQGVVKLGDRTSILLVVERATIPKTPAALPETALPKVDGLAIGPASGPQTASYQSRVGRTVTTSTAERWVIPVRPLRAGEYEIPGLEIEVDGRRHATQPLVLKVVEDMTGAELGFLEVRPSSARVVEGQPFSIEVRFGWDASLTQVNFADLSLAFADGLSGAIDVEDEFPPPGAKRIERGVTVNGGADVVVQELPPTEVRGRTFRRLRLVRSFLPTRGGQLEVPESFLNFGTLEERGSFFDRRSVKTQDYYVQAPLFHVDVVPLPEAGQPIDFTGAVGAIEVRASVDRRDVDQGESIKLTVEWTGAGNLEFFDAPALDRLEAFAGFRVYGRTEQRSFDRRTTVYDVAPLDPGVDAIPPVPLSVYDPEKEAYVTVATGPIPIRVRPLAKAAALVDEEASAGAETARDLRDVDARPPSFRAGGGDAGGGPPLAAVVLLLVLAPAAGLSARTLVRRRGDPAAPVARRRRAARRRLARALEAARRPEDELRALARFLADRSGEPEEAWVGRDVERALAARANGRSVESEHARELKTLIDRLERAVWSGGGEPVPKAEVLRLADRLIGGGL